MICCVESGRDADDAAAGVSGPDRAVGLRQDALGALQPFTSEPDRASVDPEVQDGVRAEGRGRHRQTRIKRARSGQCDGVALRPRAGDATAT